MILHLRTPSGHHRHACGLAQHPQGEPYIDLWLRGSHVQLNGHRDALPLSIPVENLKHAGLCRAGKPIEPCELCLEAVK